MRGMVCGARVLKFGVNWLSGNLFPLGSAINPLRPNQKATLHVWGLWMRVY